MKFTAKGLTIVEILVVIAIISLLAIALIMILNPLEQIKKAKDQRKLGDARELLTGYDRYYASYLRYPWEESTVIPANIPSTIDAKNPGFSDNTQNSWHMLEKGEVKVNFPNRKSIIDNDLWVSVNANGNESVCFEPESNNARNGALAPIKTKLNTYHVLPNTPNCDQPYKSALSDCYVCLPF